MSGDGFETFLWGPKQWGLKEAFTGSGAKPAPIPTAPSSSDASVQDASRKERQKLLQGQGSTIYGGIINPSEDDVVKKKALLGGG